VRAQVAAMKVARDKLLVELDLQMMEGERLALENRSLGAEVLELREHCAAWESQAQAAIAQVGRRACEPALPHASLKVDRVLLPPSPAHFCGAKHLCWDV
jgi:hypothetical protein